MRKSAVRRVVVLLVPALALGGCQGMSDSDATKAQGTGIGALGGGLIGGFIGAASSKNKTKGALTGALIGGAIGGLAGYAWGSSVAATKQKYATREEQLRQCAAAAHRDNEAAAQRVAKMDQELAALKAQQAQPATAPGAVAASTRATTVQDAQAQAAARDRADKLKAAAQANKKELKEQIDAQKTVLKGDETTAQGQPLHTELDGMEAKLARIDELEAQSVALTSAR